MLAMPQAEPNPSLVEYSRSLYEYTLRLWTESRRMAEQKAQARAKSMEKEGSKAPDKDGKK